MEERSEPEDAPDGYDLEEAADLEPVVHAVCPLCHGTRLTAQGVCLRCGEQPAADAPHASAEDEAEPQDFTNDAAPPLATMQTWDRWVPALLAGVAGVILFAGILAGARGLFPLHDEPETAVPWMPRLIAAIRLPVFTIAWTCCAVAALATIAWIENRPIGSVTVAAWRLLAAVLVAHLVTFLALPWRGVSFTVELLGQAMIVAALTAVLFQIRVVLAVRVVLLTLCYGIGLIALARMIAWALSA